MTSLCPSPLLNFWLKIHLQWHTDNENLGATVHHAHHCSRGSSPVEQPFGKERERERGGLFNEMIVVSDHKVTLSLTVSCFGESNNHDVLRSSSQRRKTLRIEVPKLSEKNIQSIFFFYFFILFYFIFFKGFRKCTKSSSWGRWSYAVFTLALSIIPRTGKFGQGFFCNGRLSIGQPRCFRCSHPFRQDSQNVCPSSQLTACCTTS